MLHILTNRGQIYNKQVMDYCRKSTNESIKKIIELEKKTPIEYIIQKEVNSSINYVNLNKSQDVISKKSVALFAFLSVTPFIYYFITGKK